MKNLLELLKVKSLVTINVMLVFTVLALRGVLDPKDVMIIVTAVITYYFAKATMKTE